MIFVTYVLIGASCLMILWTLHRFVQSFDRSEAEPFECTVFLLGFSLVAVSAIVIGLMLLQLEAYRLLPGILMLATTSLFAVFIALRKQRKLKL